MRHNIIGDIHGRKTWKEAFDPDAVNIFVGDYFDAFNDRSADDCIRNLSEIIELKRANPGSVVLLFGNHDIHYFDVSGQYSRRCQGQASHIRRFLTENMQQFHGVAYSIDDKVLVSHAGVTLTWLEKHGFPEDDDITPDNVARHCNELFFSGYEDNSHYWSGLDNYEPVSRDGENADDPPVWVRPAVLFDDNAFADTEYFQVVGTRKRLAFSVKRMSVLSTAWAYCRPTATLRTRRSNTKTKTS